MTHARSPPGSVVSARKSSFHCRDPEVTATDGRYPRGKLIYELYIGSDRSLNLWSPAGGLRSSNINQSLGVTVPNNGTTITAEISAQANSSITLRVNGTDKTTISGLAGASTGNPRYLTAGIEHYDTGGTSDGKTVNHSQLGLTTLGWLSARTS